jgi:uncharacterized protein
MIRATSACLRTLVATLPLISLGMSLGCGVPAPESSYVAMPDGTELAVDVWLPPQPRDAQIPAILRLSRYWRDYELPKFFPKFVGKYLGYTAVLNQAGYAVVAVDVRGTGASFGVSTAPFSPAETGDFVHLVDWIVAQPWSNGRVGGMGISYEGVCADWLAACDRPAVTAVLPLYSYSDIYRDVSHPGGIFNQHFVRNWSEVVARMDRNDTSFLTFIAAANPRSLLAIFVDAAAATLLGVRPITGAADVLVQAIAEHQQNPSVFDAARQIEFRDDPFAGVAVDSISPLLGPATRARTPAIRRVVGWLDAGTARGALTSFLTLDVADHVVVIVPHTHTGNYRADPYETRFPAQLDTTRVLNEEWQPIPFFGPYLKGEGREPRRFVRYYTYVENTWHQTETWPPEGFETQRWYFAAERTLTREHPDAAEARDEYTVDFKATTGGDNRWFSGMSGVPIRYIDRKAQDKRLLVYETPAFEQAVELTGHPVLSLSVSSTHADGAFYAYLEDVAPNGDVFYLTEGQLRAVHRRVTDSAPLAAFGPAHTFRRSDAQPLVPGERAELSFDLLPISTVIRRGHRLRLALAGHDADTFVRYPAEGTPTWTVYRQHDAASWIDMPLKPRPD